MRLVTRKEPYRQGSGRPGSGCQRPNGVGQRLSSLAREVVVRLSSQVSIFGWALVTDHGVGLVNGQSTGIVAENEACTGRLTSE
jgi:hypothetical protein